MKDEACQCTSWSICIQDSYSFGFSQTQISLLLRLIMRRHFVALFLLLSISFSNSAAVCWEPGRHPGFRSAPRVWQLTIDRVRLSWKGIVTKRACVDNFVVKYWQRLDAREYKVSPLIEAHRYFVDLNVIPYVIYHYEVSAREESGLGKVTYNRAPVITFQTSRHGGSSARSRQYFARYHDGDFGQDYFEEMEDDYNYDGDDGDGSWTDGVSRLPPPTGDSPFQIMGVAGEMFIIACVILAALTMVAMGIAYKVTTSFCLPLICDNDDDDEEDDDDDDDDDEEDERDELDIEMEKKLAVLDSDADDGEDGDSASDDSEEEEETTNGEARVNLV